MPQISPIVETFYKTKVVSMQGLNVDVFCELPKQRDVHLLPVVVIDKPSIVASDIPEPDEIVRTEEYLGKSVPDDALNEVVTRIKKDCEVSKYCNDVAHALHVNDIPIRRGLLQFFTWL